MTIRIPSNRKDLQSILCIGCNQNKGYVDIYYLAEDIAVCDTCHVVGRHCSTCRKFFSYNEIGHEAVCLGCVTTNSRQKRRMKRLKKAGLWQETPKVDKRKQIRTAEQLERYERKRLDRHYQRNFGISYADYEEMFIQQNGLCAICGKAETFTGMGNKPARLQVDHCHDTKVVRRLLCRDCNVMIGGSKDNVLTLEKAILYLKMYKD